MFNKYKNILTILLILIIFSIFFYINSPSKTQSHITKQSIHEVTAKQISEECSDIGIKTALKIKKYIKDNNIQKVEDIDPTEISYFAETRYSELSEHFY